MFIPCGIDWIDNAKRLSCLWYSWILKYFTVEQRGPQVFYLRLRKKSTLFSIEGAGPFPVDEEEAPIDREDSVGGQLAGLLCPCYYR